MLEFIIEFILAMIFILFFKVQKLFLPDTYFAFSDPFILGESVSPSKYLLRSFVIFFFNMFFYLILNIFYEGQEILNLLLIASFLGAFLILWPIIFKPSRNLEGGLSKKSIFFLYCIYISILISSMIISLLTTSIMNLFFNDMDIVTVFSSNKEGIIFEILMLPILSVFEAVFTHKYKSVRNENVSNMNINNNIDGEDDEHYIDDYEYSKSRNENFKYTAVFITFINLGLLVFDIIKKKK